MRMISVVYEWVYTYDRLVSKRGGLGVLCRRLGSIRKP